MKEHKELGEGSDGQKKQKDMVIKHFVIKQKNIYNFFVSNLNTINIYGCFYYFPLILNLNIPISEKKNESFVCNGDLI